MLSTYLDKVVPTYKEIKDQPEREFIFFYTDGGSPRAVAASNVSVHERSVEAFDEKGKSLITIPIGEYWRFIRQDCLNFVTGAQLEEKKARESAQSEAMFIELNEKYDLTGRAARMEELEKNGSGKGYKLTGKELQAIIDKKYL